MASGFEQAGIEPVQRRPDVAVVTASEASVARAAEARAIIVVGRSGRRSLRSAPLIVRRFAVLPPGAEPHLVIPTDRYRVAAYALRNWTASESRLRRIRNRVAAAAIALRSLPDLPRSLTAGLPDRRPPFLVAASEQFGVPADVDWFLTLGLGDALTRGVFHLFPRASVTPRWAVKFSRVVGHAEPFEREERGLEMARAAGGAVAARAPRLFGRFEAARLPASLEQAAAGQRLTFVLQSPGRRADKLAVIDAVARWIVDVGRESASPGSMLAEERRRLEAQVLPAWALAGTPGDLLARVPEVPAVLQHNDLGCWNLIVDGAGFMAVDWESARRYGFPLWDLLYFLVDALVHLDRAWEPDRRERYAAELLCGRCDSSRILFERLRDCALALDIPAAAVGPIATLGWLHHGLSSRSRAGAMQALGADPTPGGQVPDPQTPGATYDEWMAPLWLRTPGLGPEWSAAQQWLG